MAQKLELCLRRLISRTKDLGLGGNGALGLASRKHGPLQAKAPGRTAAPGKGQGDRWCAWPDRKGLVIGRI